MTRLSVTPTKTGTAPTDAMAPGTGASVKALVRTRSPGFTPTARSAVASAYPPDATARQYFAPDQSANSRSSSATWLSSPGAVL